MRTPSGKGVVIALHLLKELVQVRLEGDEAETVLVSASEVEVLVSAKQRRSGKR